MSKDRADDPDDLTPAHWEQIRVRGLVQGVGFRPHVWRIAQSLGLHGDVRNDGDGVLIRLGAANPGSTNRFIGRLEGESPPLARIDCIERSLISWDKGAGMPSPGFSIIASAATGVHTSIVPDAAICPDCAADIGIPDNRRYRYPFTNCTHCGPRLSIIDAIPYDRANTSMRHFPMCSECAHEYDDPADRRFHAQPNACPICGPRTWIEDSSGRLIDPSAAGALDAASRMLAKGQIVAIKGIGGFHLACDATNPEAVQRLRQRKARDAKPFALMARDHEVISRYCLVSAQERLLLEATAAPIVLLQRKVGEAAPALAPGIAPGHNRLGLMLPYSPLHCLLLRDWAVPLVMTSGNLSDEPQSIDNQDARARLAAIADALLLHNRNIRNRLDDSVARVDSDRERILRRARGYAPAPLPVPDGFEQVPPVLALGGELKSAFCLLDAPRLIVSQHLGDLDKADNLRAFELTLTKYLELFQHHPRAVAVDAHPDYRSSQFGRRFAATAGLTVFGIQHHFAHIAAVLGENAWPRCAGPVLGLALDGLGYGSDGSLWGGEWLRADYTGFRRIGWLRPTPLPGSDQAARQPWRNLLAQLHASFGWEQAQAAWPMLRHIRAFEAKPVGMLARMIDAGLNAPLSSSAGRLFDAVAAALGLCPDSIAYEGQAAMELEALAGSLGRTNPNAAPAGYPFAQRQTGDGIELDPAPMWQTLLDDLSARRDAALIAARFHAGFARSLVELSLALAATEHLDTLAVSGGVFQNQVLFESVIQQARAAGLRVLTHRQVPSNDGGIALGQALIAAAQLATSSLPGASGETTPPANLE